MKATILILFVIILGGCTTKNDVSVTPSDTMIGTWVLKGSTGSSPASKLVFSESGGTKTLRFDCSGAPTANLPSVAETPYKFESNRLSFIDYTAPKNGYYDVTSFEWVIPGKEFTVKFHQILLYISADTKVSYVKVE